MRTSVPATVLAAVLTCGGAAFPQTPPEELPPLPPLPPPTRAEELQREIDRIDAEMRQIGGGQTIEQSVSNVENADVQVKEDIKRLDEAIEQLGGTADGMHQVAQELGDAALFTGQDALEEGRDAALEKGGKTALEAFGKTGLSRFLGWAALVGDVVEYGGKWVIRAVNKHDMMQLVIRQHITMRDLYVLGLQLRQQETAIRQDKARLQALQEQKNRANNELAAERAKSAPTPRATKGMDPKRDRDPAGDKEELRLHQQEQKKKARVVLAAGVGGAAAVVGLLAAGGGSEGAAATPPSQPAAPQPPAPPAAPPSTTGGLPTGMYAVNLVCVDNPGGHHEFVRGDQVTQVEVSGVATLRSASAAAVTFSGPSPWVGMSGEWDAATGRFSATGRGRVAGNANVRCNFEGTLTPSGELAGDIVMGVGGGLPGGRTVTYRVQGRKN